MTSSKRTAIFGVCVMLVAAVAPAMAAAAPAGDAGADAIDSQPTFQDLPDNETDDNETESDDNETDDEDVNETEDEDVNDTNESEVNETEDEDANETDLNASSTAEAAKLFSAKLQQVIDNATNDSSVQAPGHVIASYVVANNPGNAPDHAGPPAENSTQGPPENASGPPNGTPGADGNDSDGNETDGGPGANGNGGGNGNGNGPKAIVAADGFDGLEVSLPRVELAAPFDALN